jgi:LAO/AO transport system kinase
MWQTLHNELVKGDVKALARSISLVESETEGFENFLASLPSSTTKIIGITGPPGAGKSTLVDALIGEVIKENKKVAVLCVDPSSPFHFGALLGDRVRMTQWYTQPNVFIRSLATKGSLGGLHPKIIEITSLVCAAGFDYVFVETVGVGQSEVEIAGLSDVTVVVLVPESGDDIQSMKAGLMEIADIFVVNKSDRPGADTVIKQIRLMLAPVFSSSKKEIPIVKTIASQGEGVPELFDAIKKHLNLFVTNEKKYWLLTEKAWHLIQDNRTKDLNKKNMFEKIRNMDVSSFNLYRFAKQFYTSLD